MRLLSWIFQPVYLIFFVIITALYIYREEIIPEHRDIEQSRALIARMEQSVAVIEEESRDFAPLFSGDATITGADDSHQQAKLETEASQQGAEEIAQPSVIEELPAELVVDGDKGLVEITVSEREVATPSRQLETAGVAPLAEQADTATLIEPAVQPIDEPPKSFGALWYAARKAARSGNREQAVEGYLQLTSNYPESADGFGELGNIYYAMGDKERALVAYQQALIIYQSAGYSGQSLQLQRVIAEIQ